MSVGHAVPKYPTTIDGSNPFYMGPYNGEGKLTRNGEVFEGEFEEGNY